MRSTIAICFLGILMIRCVNSNTSNVKARSVEEIQKAEKEFAQMAAEKGIAEAFWYYADSNAVVLRNDSLVRGKDAIRRFYSNPFYSTAKVEWAPDFTEASEDGNLGYTYGRYIWRTQDSIGKQSEYRGVFHTVWKKQKDGSWKYVWD